MKFCINCGKEVKEKVKFCPFCGAEQKELKKTDELVEEVKVEEINSLEEAKNVSVQSDVDPKEYIIEEDTSTIYNEQPKNDNQEQVSPHQTSNNQQAPLISINQGTVNQLTDNSKNYFSYINKNIAKPDIGGRNKNEYFGLVSYVLISLFSSLAISHSIGKAMTFGTRGYSDSSFPMFLQLFLLLLVTQLVSVTTVYVLSGKIFHEEIKFLDSFDRIYAPVSITVYTSLLAFVLSFISTVGFSFLLVLSLLITYTFSSFSFIANLWVSQNNTQRNRFYWTVGVIIVSSIVQIIVSFMLGDIIGASIIEIISDIADSFASSLFF